MRIINSMNRNRLQDIMNEQEISYGKLSKQTGVSKSALHNIANFYQSPTQDTMIAIAKGLHMKVTDIFYLD